MAERAGFYIVKLDVQQPGLLGAPVLTLNLGVNATNGQVYGSGSISQSITPVYPTVEIAQLSGQILHTGFGEDTLLVSLTGDYLVSFPPPAIGSYLAKFTAALAVDSSWNGKGVFSYGNHNVTDCTVTNVSQDAQQPSETKSFMAN